MKATQDDIDRDYARVSRSRNAVKEELRQLTEDVEELIRRIGGAADPELANLRNNVQAAISSAREAIESRTEWPTQRAREAMAAGAAHVRERPWYVVGIAGLLGLAVGFLVARRDGG